MTITNVELMSIDPEKTGFMLNLWASDVSADQFLRELTQNSIEAIQELPFEQAGNIYWQNDPEYEQQYKAPKLSIIDNGVGMSPEDLMQYIKKLGNSSKHQSIKGNFGIGARLAALKFNPLGVVVQSWKNGKGHQITLLEASENQYGVHRVEGVTGFETVVELADEYRPTSSDGTRLIENHGTKVTLLGKWDGHNTMRPPDGVKHGQLWLVHNLNKRYFRIPKNITLTAPRLDHDYVLKSNQMVQGQEHYLNEHSIDSGRVRLATSEVKWWIVDEKTPFRAWEFAGHIAALYQDELYDPTTTSTRNARMSLFGIHSQKKRVVLYVEPDIQGVSSTPGRRALLLNGDPFPWEQIGAEFYSNMPSRLRKFIEENLDLKELENLQKMRDSQDERIKALNLNFPQYVESRKGVDESEMEDVREVTFVDRFGDGEHGPVNDVNGNGSKLTRKRATRTLKPSPNAKTVKEINQWQRPSVIWKSLEDGREEGDLEDRMGRYTKTTNILELNADFRGFKDLIDRAIEFRGAQGDPSVQEIIRKAAKALVETVVVDHIVAGYRLQGSKHWDDDDIGTIYSEEAITASVMSETLIFKELKWLVGQELQQHPQGINEESKANKQKQPVAG